MTKHCRLKLALALTAFALVECGNSAPTRFEAETTGNDQAKVRLKRHTGLSSLLNNMLLRHSDGADEQWSDILRPGRYEYHPNRWSKFRTPAFVDNKCENDIDYIDSSYEYHPLYKGNTHMQPFQYPTSNNGMVIFPHRKSSKKLANKLHSYSYVPSYGYDTDWTALLPSHGQIDYGDLSSGVPYDNNFIIQSSPKHHHDIENVIDDEDPPPSKLSDVFQCSCNDLGKLVNSQNLPKVPKTIDDDYMVLFIKKNKVLDWSTISDETMSTSTEKIVTQAATTPSIVETTGNVRVTSSPKNILNTCNICTTTAVPSTTLAETSSSQKQTTLMSTIAPVTIIGETTPTSMVKPTGSQRETTIVPTLASVILINETIPTTPITPSSPNTTVVIPFTTKVPIYEYDNSTISVSTKVTTSTSGPITNTTNAINATKLPIILTPATVNYSYPIPTSSSPAVQIPSSTERSLPHVPTVIPEYGQPSNGSASTQAPVFTTPSTTANASIIVTTSTGIPS